MEHPPAPNTGRLTVLESQEVKNSVQERNTHRQTKQVWISFQKNPLQYPRWTIRKCSDNHPLTNHISINFSIHDLMYYVVHAFPFHYFLSKHLNAMFANAGYCKTTSKYICSAYWSPGTYFRYLGKLYAQKVTSVTIYMDSHTFSSSASPSSMLP